MVASNRKECTGWQNETIVMQLILLCNGIVWQVYVPVCMCAGLCCYIFWPERQDILVRLAPIHNYIMDLVFMQHMPLPKLSLAVTWE